MKPGLLRRALGLSICAAAALFAAVTLIALLDPAGTQAANDADPFGAPPSLPRLCAQLAVSAAVLAGGIWLSWRPARRSTGAAATELSRTQAADRSAIRKEFR